MKLYLAPIKGITDFVFRAAFFRHFGGFDLAYAPFLSSSRGRKIRPGFLRDILPDNNRGISLVPQVLGKDPDDILFLVKRIMELGFGEVNWNIGCPTPMVANKKRGSGILPHPEMVEKILSKVCAIFPDQISVKSRIGRRDGREIDSLMPIFNRYPLRRLIVHPRLGVQMYKGDVDLAAFARCAALAQIPLVYNGDIVDCRSLEERQRLFPEVDEWMVGRGALMNPYLGRRLRGESVVVERSTLKRFHDEIFNGYAELLAGPGHLLGRMKGFWLYYSAIFRDAPRCRKRIHKARSVDHYLDAVKNNFQEEELADL